MPARCDVGSRGARRGASLIECLLLIGCIALAALVGFRAFARSTHEVSTGQAACVQNLDCDQGAQTAALTPADGLAAPDGGGVPQPQGGGSWLDGALGFLGGAAGAVWDFGKGFVLQGVDTVVGIWELVSDPVGTIEGLGYAITHPGETWDALSSAVVDSWNKNPSETLGRGTFEVVTFFVAPLKVAKAAKLKLLAKGADAADNAADAGRAGGVLADGARAELPPPPAQKALPPGEALPALPPGAAQADEAAGAAKAADDAPTSAAPEGAATKPAAYGGNPRSADLYERLGVDRNATPDEIRAAYRKAARARHPDVAHDAAATEDFKAIGEAYETLSDAQKRAAYDTANPPGAAHPPAAPGAASPDLAAARNTYAEALARRDHREAFKARAAYSKQLSSKFDTVRQMPDGPERFEALKQVFAEASEQMGKGVVEDPTVDLGLSRQIFREVEAMRTRNLGTPLAESTMDFLDANRHILGSGAYSTNFGR